MNKILVAFFIIISGFLTAYADFIPQNSDSIKHYGIGVMRINNALNIYEEKDENSKILQRIYWDRLENYNNLLKISERNTFVLFYPKRDYAFLSVEDENEEETWYQVCYDQENKLYGWVHQGESAKYYSWPDFIMIFGKKHGLSIFDNKENKNLYANAQDDAKIVDTYNYAKYIEPWFVNGNWLMVKIIDIDNKQKTGYIRWRTDDGKLLLFVKFR